MRVAIDESAMNLANLKAKYDEIVKDAGVLKVSPVFLVAL